MRPSPEDMAGHVEGGQAILRERRVHGGGCGLLGLHQPKVKASGKSWAHVTAFEARDDILSVSVGKENGG